MWQRETWDEGIRLIGRHQFEKLVATCGMEAARKTIAKKKEQIEEQAVRKFKRSVEFQNTINKAKAHASTKTKMKARLNRISCLCTLIKKELKHLKGKDAAIIDKFGLQTLKNQIAPPAPERKFRLVGPPR